MTNKNISLIALGLIILNMICFFIRVKKHGIKSEIKNNKSFIIKEISIYTCAMLILCIIWFVDFGLIGNLVLCGCSVLSVELANRELLSLAD